MVRDPSAIIIAFVLPFVSILIYMYGINLDATKVTIGIKNGDGNPEIAALVKAFGHSKYINSIVYDSEKDIESAIMKSKLKGAVIIPNDFSKKLSAGTSAAVQIITDGSEVNTANYVQNYVNAILSQWLLTSKFKSTVSPQIITPELRAWYNQDLNSRHFILPGSIAATMTLIGILLTALVVAREWERGTMEALLTTKVRKIDIVLGKYIPYLVLGMASMVFNFVICVYMFGVPFRGNFLIFSLVSGLFLLTCFGIGLIISSITKNQFLASQVALGIGFLPSLLLSGLMFPINSMPKIFQFLTHILPPRYFATFVESEFLAGTLWKVVMVNTLFLVVLALLLFSVVYNKTEMRLSK